MVVNSYCYIQLIIKLASFKCMLQYTVGFPLYVCVVFFARRVAILQFYCVVCIFGRTCTLVLILDEFAIACIAVSRDGNKVATASTKASFGKYNCVCVHVCVVG